MGEKDRDKEKDREEGGWACEMDDEWRVAHVGERGTGQRVQGEMSVMRMGSYPPPPSTLFLYKIKYRDVPGLRFYISGLNTRLIILLIRLELRDVHAFLY